MFNEEGFFVTIITGFSRKEDLFLGILEARTIFPFLNISLRAVSNLYLFIHQLESSILPAGKMLSDQIYCVLYILFLEQGANNRLRAFFPSRKDTAKVFGHSWN